MQAARMLLVEDDTAMRQMLGSLFEAEGFQVAEASNARDAIGLARGQDFDVVLSDIKMPGRSGIELMGDLRALRPATPVVLMTAFGTPGVEADALDAGAFDYAPKPFEPEQVLDMVRRAVEQRLAGLRARSRDAKRPESGCALVSQSPSMCEVTSLVWRAARSDAHVLILGEAGTGKEVVARSLHQKSARGMRPFLRVDCGDAREMLERELFGCVDGGAVDRGVFERADGGTVYLDGIDGLDPELQRELTHVLQDQEVRPAGAVAASRVDVRVIAATARDLTVEMESGRFRDDLYYSLNVIPIRLRPLRERPEDIPLLIELFTQRHEAARPRGFSEAAIRKLRALPWRGNARELENVVVRALALTDAEVVQIGDLPLDDSPDALAVDSALGLGLAEAARAGLTLREIENRYIRQMLARTGGRKGEAAQRLGIDRKTLYRRDLSH